MLMHLGEEEKHFGSISPPIFHTSTYAFDEVDEWIEALDLAEDREPVYSRTLNPTRQLAEAKIAALEGMECCRLFSSGMGAIHAAMMSCVKAGSHIIAVDSIYGPARKLLTDHLAGLGIETTFVPGDDPADFEKALRPTTSLVCLESPGSIVFRLQDIKAVCDIAQNAGASVMLDNSYATPLFQRPGDFGVDIVVHSVSKYLGGHSDVVAGALCCNKERMEKLIPGEVDLYGAALSPFSAWLTIRGLRTLPIRMKAAEEGGNVIAAHVCSMGIADKIMHVGAGDFPQAELRDRQMNGTSSLFSFIPKDQSEDGIRRFVESLMVYQLGVSWGGYESLVVPILLEPMDWDEPKYVVRLYTGLENLEDLKADLTQAAKTAGWV